MNKFNAEQIKKFVMDYNIRDVNIEYAQTRKATPFSWNYSSYSQDMYYEHEEIKMFKMSIPEYSLEEVVSIVSEFDELMRDPESAKLLMEARFIHRLKHGSKI